MPLLVNWLNHPQLPDVNSNHLLTLVGGRLEFDCTMRTIASLTKNASIKTWNFIVNVFARICTWMKSIFYLFQLLQFWICFTTLIYDLILVFICVEYEQIHQSKPGCQPAVVICQMSKQASRLESHPLKKMSARQFVWPINSGSSARWRNVKSEIEIMIQMKQLCTLCKQC